MKSTKIDQNCQVTYLQESKIDDGSDDIMLGFHYIAVGLCLLTYAALQLYHINFASVTSN